MSSLFGGGLRSGGDIEIMTNTAYARRLRKNMTEAEQRLWRHLRQKQLEGFKFRRQCPIGPYIVDFVCLEAMLVVEIDDGHHSYQTQADAECADWLSGQGYRVFRFWNHEVLQQTENILQAILGNATQTPSKPSATGGQR